MTTWQIAEWISQHQSILITFFVTMLSYRGAIEPLREYLRQKKVRESAVYAYEKINNLSRTTENTYDDKAAAGLRVFIDALDLFGLKPTESETERAKLIFTELHEKDTKLESLLELITSKK